MSNKPFIDIHTHKINNNFDIESIYIPKLNTFNQHSSKFCLGLHPWEVDNYSIEDVLYKIEDYLSDINFWALGEIGLDKLKPNFSKQLEYFDKQLQFAIDNRVQRIVIHNVKADQEVFHGLKKSNFKGHIIFHDWNSNSKITNQFLKYFNAYFSFGDKLFKPQTTSFKNFEEIDLTRVFLETDDQENHDIYEVYEKAAQLRGLPLSSLQSFIRANLLKIS